MQTSKRSETFLRASAMPWVLRQSQVHGFCHTACPPFACARSRTCACVRVHACVCVCVCVCVCCQILNVLTDLQQCLHPYTKAHRTSPHQCGPTACAMPMPCITHALSLCHKVAAVDYHVHRISNGVPEGVADFKVAKSFPFESNLDYMRGVHFDKGCYLGQEPTARTFFRGATRKRLVPVQFYPSLDALEAASPEQKGVVVESGGAAPAPDTALRALGKGRSGGDRDGDGDGEGEGEGRAAGTVCSTVHNIGLALVRLPATGPMVAAREAGGEWYAKAFVPTWWEARGTGK